MADAPRNPMAPPNSRAAAEAHGPARGGAGISDADIQKTLNFMGKFHTSAADLADIFGKISGKVGGVSEKIKDMHSELRQTVTFSDSLEDSMKAIMGYQIRMAREGMKITDVETMKNLFENMRKSTKSMAEEGIFGRRGGAKAQEILDGMDAKMASLQKRMKGTKLDPKLGEEFHEYLLKINKEVVGLARNLKGVRLTGLQQDVHHASIALRHLTGGKTGKLDKWDSYAATGREIREGKAAREAGRVKEFAARRDALAQKHIPGWGLKSAHHRKDNGELTDASKKYRASLLTKHGGKFQEGAGSGKNGLGAMASSILTKHLLAEATGVKAGFGTRVGMGLLARGNGSLTKGAASLATGAIEGGAGAIAELAGPLAPLLVGLELLKDTFDKNQKLNADVHDKLGQGGIYGGGSNAIDSIAQVRRNLNRTGMVNSLGIGYDKNLVLAQQMVEGGFNVSNLASGDLSKRKDGTLEGSFGTMQRNSYMYGRAAGLNPTQTMSQTLKLITVYDQSLSSTEDFFVRISRDSRAAGISTMKYIDIIDQVNNQYDRSNKMLMTTVGTMKLLSQTGRDTADDLKEAMGTLTNGGKRMDLPHTAYINQQLMRDPEGRRMLQGGVDYQLQSSLQNLLPEMKGFGDDKYKTVEDLQKGLKTGGLGFITELGRQSDAQFQQDHDSGRNIAMQEALRQVTTRYTNQQDLMHNLRLDPSTGGLKQGIAEQNAGSDQLTDMIHTFGIIKSGMQQTGHSMVDFMHPERQTSPDNDIKFKTWLDSFNVQPGEESGIRSLMMQGGASRMKTISDGLTPEEAADPNSASRKAKEEGATKLYNELHNRKDLGFEFKQAGANQTKASAMQENALAHPVELTKALTELDSTFSWLEGPDGLKTMTDVMTPEKKSEAETRATEVVTATRPMADIFADAFTWLFNQLILPMKDIDDMIARYLPGGHATASAESKAAFDAVGSTPAAITAQEAYNRAHPEDASGPEDLLALKNAGNPTITIDQATMDHATDKKKELLWGEGALVRHHFSSFLAGNNLEPDSNPQSSAVSGAWEQQHRTSMFDAYTSAGKADVKQSSPFGDGRSALHIQNTTNVFNNVEFPRYSGTQASVKNAPGAAPPVPAASVSQFAAPGGR